MLIFLWVVFSLVVGAFAHGRGRSFLAWAITSLLISPAVGAILVAISGKSGTAAMPKDSDGMPMTPKTHVRCPDCRSLIRKDARVCAHCSASLIPQT